MTYRQLYDHCQNLPIAISRGSVRPKIAELTGHAFKVAKTTLDVRVCRGMYLSPRNTTEKIVQQLGCHIIVMPREGNNYCWGRFVEIKEYMHIFDTDDEATDTGDEFDQLLAEFCEAGAVQRSEQMNGEIKAFWRALGVLCPEKVRQEFIAEKAARGVELTDYAMAFRLRIPEQYVPCLFEAWYLENQQRLFD